MENIEVVPNSSSSGSKGRETQTSASELESSSVGVDNDILCVQQLIKVSVFLATCGWSPIASASPTVGLSEISPTAIASEAAGVTKVAEKTIQSKGKVAKQTNKIDSFKCDFCGRCFPFKYLLTSFGIDPFFQHRSFCLWAKADNEGGGTSLPGWLLCARALVNDREGDVITGHIGNGVSGQNKASRRLSRGRESLSPGSGGAGSERAGTVKDDYIGVDAEYAYKKIKLVLDFSALPRVTHKGKSSL